MLHSPCVYNIARYNNIYDGEAVVVGSGPTLFEYEDLSTFKCPIFFINDAVRFQKYTHHNDCFFFTHHAGEFQDLVESLSKIITRHARPIFFYPLRCICATDMFDYVNNPVRWRKPRRSELHFKTKRVFYDVYEQRTRLEWKNNKSISKFPDWCLDRNEIIRRQGLIAHTGSITSLIHFLWFSGIKKVKLIGCPHKFIGNYNHDERISQIPGAFSFAGFDLKSILENQVKFLDFFNIQSEYVI